MPCEICAIFLVMCPDLTVRHGIEVVTLLACQLCSNGMCGVVGPCLAASHAAMAVKFAVR